VGATPTMSSSHGECCGVTWEPWVLREHLVLDKMLEAGYLRGVRHSGSMKGRLCVGDGLYTWGNPEKAANGFRK